jgi:hypothetical protein
MRSFWLISPFLTRTRLMIAHARFGMLRNTMNASTKFETLSASYNGWTRPPISRSWVISLSTPRSLQSFFWFCAFLLLPYPEAQKEYFSANHTHLNKHSLRGMTPHKSHQERLSHTTGMRNSFLTQQECGIAFWHNVMHFNNCRQLLQTLVTVTFQTPNPEAKYRLRRESRIMTRNKDHTQKRPMVLFASVQTTESFTDNRSARKRP